MKTQRTLIATCIAALFASSAVMAKDKWEYNEDKWDDTRSYGSVSLDKDSVQQWGPWEQFVEPAAGAPSIALLGAGVSDPYRNLPQTNQVKVDDVCRAGDWCGYAVYRNYEWKYQYYQDDGEGEGYGGYSTSKESRPYAGRFGLTLKPDDPSVVTIDGGEGPGQVSWRLAALAGNAAPVLGASHDPMNANFGDWYYYYNYTGGLHNFYASQQTSDTSAYDYSTVYGYPHDGSYYYYWYLPTSNKEVAAGYFYRYIYDYVSGDGAEMGRQTYGSYVAGIATPQAYLDAQRAGNVIASYQGNSVDGYYGYQIPVSMTVNFGNATWNGSWNGGSDGSSAYQYSDSYGNKYVSGQIGFNASGTVSGANIQSTSVSALDGTVTGKVQGTFYGQTAGSIGGVHDIVKTRPEVYTASSNVGVFLVDKVQAPQVSQIPR